MKPTRSGQSAPVELRIRNAADVDFDRIRVFLPDSLEVDFGPVPKSGLSAFHPVSRACRYAGIEVQAAGRSYSLQPADYLGEKELPAGRYTYSVNIAGGQLTLELEKVP